MADSDIYGTDNEMGEDNSHHTTIIPFPSCETSSPCILFSHGSNESVGMNILTKTYRDNAGTVSDSDLFRELARKYENEIRLPILAINPNTYLPELNTGDFRRHFTRHVVSSPAIMRQELVTLSDIQQEFLRHGMYTTDGIDTKVFSKFLDISKHKLNICRHLTLRENPGSSQQSNQEQQKRY